MPDAYFQWLKELIGDGYIEGQYQKLLWKLYSTPFYYELDYDRNRAVDGLDLRRKYFTRIACMPEPMMSNGEMYPCSVLEMMIALARRAEDNLTYDPDLGDSTGRWFWIMMENLGLDVYDDYGYFEENVSAILNVFMHHLYASDGCQGGPFPCPGVERDLRKTDLWWQMGAYFKQHYPVQIW